MMRTAAAIVLTCALLQLISCDVASHSEHLVVVANQEVVGTLDVEVTGSRAEIRYAVDNNGRGPKIDETLEFGDDGLPRSWVATGTSLFGASIDESYAWADGVARWNSQADEGEQPASSPALYVGGDVSPWAPGMYARALLEAAGHSLMVLPSGRLELEPAESMQIGGDRLPIDIFVLKGLSLQPQLVALDAERRLFATLGGRGAVIRRGFESSVPQLQERAAAIELRRLQDIESRIARRFDGPVRYRNVRVFDTGNGTTSGPMDVIVRDGRIARLEADSSSATPGDEAIVDGEGGTLVPGLFDMHSHASLSSGLFYLAAGVTSTRDMGNDNALLAEIRRAIGAGELAGPRITPAGLIEARSPFAVRIGIVADSLEEALDAVRWYADHGYTEIKTYNSMQAEWVEPIVAEAHRLGLGVSGHVPAFVHPDEIIAMGYDAIAHINQLMLGWLLAPDEDTRTPLRLTGMKRAAELDLDSAPVQQTVALMKQHEVALDTTAVILERLMLSRARQVNPGDEPYLSHMPVGYQRYRKRSFVSLDDPGADEAYRQAFDVLLDVIDMLYEAGITLLPGTDDTTGFTLQRELELYVAAGVPAPDTLIMATRGAAAFLGQQDELGQISPGYLADFILVPGDPATDISVIRQTRLVSRGGVIYFPEEIYRELAIEPFGRKATIHGL